MTSTYHQEGAVIDYTAGSAISKGDELVVGAAGNVSVGIALEDIANGAVGAVAIGGVFIMPKVSAAVIAAGETVDWDVAAGAVDDNAMTPASGDVSDFGVAVEAAGNGVTTVKVLLRPGNGAIT